VVVEHVFVSATFTRSTLSQSLLAKTDEGLEDPKQGILARDTTSLCIMSSAILRSRVVVISLLVR
jgi:hypothetical protein